MAVYFVYGLINWFEGMVMNFPILLQRLRRVVERDEHAGVFPQRSEQII